MCGAGLCTLHGPGIYVSCRATLMVDGTCRAMLDARKASLGAGRQQAHPVAARGRAAVRHRAVDDGIVPSGQVADALPVVERPAAQQQALRQSHWDPAHAALLSSASAAAAQHCAPHSLWQTLLTQQSWLRLQTCTLALPRQNSTPVQLVEAAELDVAGQAGELRRARGRLWVLQIMWQLQNLMQDALQGRLHLIEGSLLWWV